MVRVDDRLLHGQVLGAWVPSTGADMLVVASDEAAGDSFRSAVMSACSEQGLKVIVMNVTEVARASVEGDFEEVRALLVVSSLVDAKRLYDDGLEFTSLNIGNIHHGDGKSRHFSQAVVLDEYDDEIIEDLAERGVEIDIRDLPSRPSIPYIKRTD